MSWQQIHLRLGSDDYSVAENALEDLGALSITLLDAQDQPIFEPPLGETPLWNELQLTVLFEFDTDVELVYSTLHELDGVSVLDWRSEVVEQQDWERAWMDQFEPMQFGERLWVCPSWYPPPHPEAVNLVLDPGLAFGSGTHETTALCLEWLANNEIKHCSVLDYGCGSGILAIAALKLGARSALGVDIDPQALLASRDNALRNEIRDEQLLLMFPNDSQIVPANIVLANILSGPLVQLAPTLANLTAEAGRIVLSGILTEQANDVLTAYAPWFSLEPVEIRGDWCRIAGSKTA